MSDKDESSDKGISRRNFSFGVGAAAVLFATGGAAKVVVGNESLLRPPGGQNEDDLLAKCIKCDRCRSACHTGCVAVANIGEGLLNARTPKLDFHLGFCDFCNRCIESCPTDALTPFDPETRKIGVARIDTDLCVAWVQGGCEKCVEACAYGAITLDDSSRPVIDVSLCNGCGMCEYVCPSNSYLAYSGSKRRGVNVERELG